MKKIENWPNWAQALLVTAVFIGAHPLAELIASI